MTELAQLQEVAAKTHEICMCNKLVIIIAVKGASPSADVSTGQSAGAPP